MATMIQQTPAADEPSRDGTTPRTVPQVFRSFDNGRIDRDRAIELLDQIEKSGTTRFERWLDRIFR
jgi:hypothetical protein